METLEGKFGHRGWKASECTTGQRKQAPGQPQEQIKPYKDAQRTDQQMLIKTDKDAQRKDYTKKNLKYQL